MEVKPISYRNTLIERCVAYSKRLVKFVGLLIKKREYWAIGDQLIRSGTSVGANVVEAQESQSKKDFARFLRYALKSADETRYWLELVEVEDGLDVELQYLQSETKELAKILKSSITKLEK